MRNENERLTGCLTRRSGSQAVTAAAHVETQQMNPVMLRMVGR